jgi:hypothetical protein
MSSTSSKKSQAFRKEIGLFKSDPLKSLTFLLLLCLILAACIEDRPLPPPPSLTPDPNSIPPTEPVQNETVISTPFAVDVGQSVYFSQIDLTITFESVERDGRCPSAVICSENGPVVIIISAQIGENQPTTFTMNPDPQLAQQSGIPPNIFTYQGYEIELTAVTPYPEQPEDLLNLPYTATLVIRPLS